MPSTPGSPLTDEHLSQLNGALDQAKLAQIQIDLAKRAGIDVSAAEALNQANVDKIRQIKQVYFPGQ